MGYEDLLKVACLKRDMAQDAFQKVQRQDLDLKVKIEELKAQRKAKSTSSNIAVAPSIVDLLGQSKWMDWSSREIQKLTNERVSIRIALEDTRQDAARATGKVIALEEILANQSR